MNTVVPEGPQLKLGISVELGWILADFKSWLFHVKELLWTQATEQYRKHDLPTQTEVMDMSDEIWYAPCYKWTIYCYLVLSCMSVDLECFFMRTYI